VVIGVSPAGVGSNPVEGTGARGKESPLISISVYIFRKIEMEITEWTRIYISAKSC
jgi:hypothetical protein